MDTAAATAKRARTRRLAVTIAVAATVVAVAATLAGPAAAAGTLTGATGPGGAWRKAEEVPGTAALNKGGDAGIDSVSCASAGNCGGGGFYTGSSGYSEALVVSQVHGAWGKAEEVPGTAALNEGGDAGIDSVSCASAGNCSAGGSYAGHSGGNQAFVVSQVHGTWRRAEEVPGTARLNAGANAQVWSVSCASAGNCSAGGQYASSRKPAPLGTSQAFVVTEVNGT
jgi:hypothetical protein